MINLIKNELFKIFKKKGIYIILTLLFAFLLLINYITKESSKDYHNGYIKLLKEEILLEKQSVSSKKEEESPVILGVHKDGDVIKLNNILGEVKNIIIEVYVFAKEV